MRLTARGSAARRVCTKNSQMASLKISVFQSPVPIAILISPSLCASRATHIPNPRRTPASGGHGDLSRRSFSEDGSKPCNVVAWTRRRVIIPPRMWDTPDIWLYGQHASCRRWRSPYSVGTAPTKASSAWFYFAICFAIYFAAAIPFTRRLFRRIICRLFRQYA